MTVAGWITMALSLAMVWSVTAWCFWMVLSRPRPKEAAEPAPDGVDRGATC